MLLDKKFEDPWTAQEGHWCSYRVLTKIRKIKLLLRTKNAVGPALTARKASLKVGRLPISGVGFSSQIFFFTGPSRIRIDTDHVWFPIWRSQQLIPSNTKLIPAA